jgi:uncharacterized membrane protein YhaH (DUF805 family)
MLKKFIWTIIISAGAFVISVILHNLLSAWLNTEEPVFFIIAVFVCPLAFLVGVVGSIVIAVKRYLVKKEKP